jgi:hypothetical protein
VNPGAITLLVSNLLAGLGGHSQGNTDALESGPRDRGSFILFQAVRRILERKMKRRAGARH